MSTANGNKSTNEVFVMIKPLALKHPLLADEIKRALACIGTVSRPQLRHVSRDLCRAHYRFDSTTAPDRTAKHLPAIVNYLQGQMVLSLVLTLNDTTPIGADDDFCGFIRSEIVGPSEPMKCAQKHIRHRARSMDYRVAVDVPDADRVADFQPFAKDNLIHCSDSPQSARQEIALWYPRR